MAGTPRDTMMAKCLFAVDELAGFIVACAKVRPNGVSDMKAKSVKKKWKDKRFAAGVDRQVIEKGAAMLGVELGDLMTGVIEGMRDVAAHAYSALDLEILWQGIQGDVPALLESIEGILSSEATTP